MDIQAYYSHFQTIFNSIYIHRSKDFHEDIRLTCIRHVKDFIAFDPERELRSEYLKYLGWACYDYSNQVRLDAVEAIKSLLESLSGSVHLLSFVEHFIDRFIEMASADQDPLVALTMIETLRVMQRQGFLDKVPGDKLDIVDQVVFDNEADLPVRVEALRFMMDHTEGFEEFDEAQQMSLLSKSLKKKDSLKDQLALCKQRNAALQLETLTEFAEYHLGRHVDMSHLLAEACLGSEKACK